MICSMWPILAAFLSVMFSRIGSARKVLLSGALLATAVVATHQFKSHKFSGSATPFSSFVSTAHCLDKIPFYGLKGTKYERTFIAIKPEGVQRGLVGEIIKRFEAKGYVLVAIKMVQPSESLARQHYADLADKPFFPGLVKYISSSGPVVAMVWQGKNVISYGRKIIGATDPLKSEPGTIRGDFGIDVGRNVIHGSDAPETAQKEISLWFSPEEVHEWKPENDKWSYEK